MAEEREFTLEEARSVLAALRSVSSDGLRAPFSRGDALAILAAGAEVKDLAAGLLDFPTTVEGVPAYWCWRAGEDDIEWWHPQSTGFAGRQHVDDLPPHAR